MNTYDDVDITHMDTHTTSNPLELVITAPFQGPMTRARKCRLNHEVNSFLSVSIHNYEDEMLLNSYCNILLLRNMGEDSRTTREKTSKKSQLQLGLWIRFGFSRPPCNKRNISLIQSPMELFSHSLERLRHDYSNQSSPINRFLVSNSESSKLTSAIIDRDKVRFYFLVCFV